jgi:tetratricopeptide (TPR) repeat protein
LTSLLSSEKCFEVLLKSRWQRVIFLLAVAVPGVIMGREVIRLTMAVWLTNSPHPADLRRAIALDPPDPSLYNRLGLVHLYSFEEFNNAQAVSDFRSAIALNPHVALFWLNLSSACESSGNRACAGEAIDRAVSLSPMAPRLHWAAANYYLRTGQSERVWSEFRRLLGLDPGYAELTFDLCYRAFRDPKLILDKLLPDGSDPILLVGYANFLLAHNDGNDALQVWSRAAAGSNPVTFKAADLYLEQLIALRRYQDAVVVWNDLLRSRSVARPAAADPQNLVFNGGFEQSPLNAGFDWRSADVAYASLDLSDAAPYQGSRCLRVDFTVGHNEEYELAYQLIPVATKQSYRLTGFVRSDGITSDSGPRLRVQDPECPACLAVSTGATVGTTPWHSVSLNFMTGAQTRVVRLSVWRPRSRSFPMEITGSFWLDDVAVKPISLLQGSTP